MPYTQGSFNQEDNWKIYEAVITGGGGGGGGTASAGNQLTQISQLTEGGLETPSVFKEVASGESVFLPAGVNILSKIENDLISIESALAVISGQMVDASGIPSVFKTSSDVGVFVDSFDQAVFQDANLKSVFLGKSGRGVFTGGIDEGVPVFTTPDPSTGARESSFHDTKRLMSVFKIADGKSVFVSGVGLDVAEILTQLKNASTPKGTTQVVYISAASAILLAAAVQTYIQSIAYGIGGAPFPQIVSMNFERDTSLHGCYLTYNV